MCAYLETYVAMLLAMYCKHYCNHYRNHCNAENHENNIVCAVNLQ